MTENEKKLKNSLHALQADAPSPTKEQKADMLCRIMLECRTEDTPEPKRLLRALSVCPWRAAFALSAAQAVLGTLIFGTGYTNLFLGFFGG